MTKKNATFDLLPIYKEINALCVEGRFEELNARLEKVDVKHTDVAMLLAWVRLTHLCRHELDAYCPLLKEIASELRARCINDQELLRGLACEDTCCNPQT
jgi:hypothetical protein